MSELIGEGGAAAVVGALVGGFIVGFVDLLARLLAARQQRRHQDADDAVDAVTKATTTLARAHPEVLINLDEDARERRIAEIDTYRSDSHTALTRLMVGHHATNIREAAMTCRENMVAAINFAMLYVGHFGESSVTVDQVKQARRDAFGALDELVALLHKRPRHRVADWFGNWWQRARGLLPSRAWR